MHFSDWAVPKKWKKSNRKHRTSIGEWILLILTGAFAFVLAGQLHDRGIALKWATAILGTILPFGMVIYLCRVMLKRWAFWVAIGVCLTAHIVIVWIVFEYVFHGLARVSILLWLPVALAETVALLIVVKRIHDKLSGKREVIRIGF
jgi:hypothetical protein